jgi:hypothetical protein
MKGVLPNYRKKLYSTYVSNHTLHLYGETTLDGIIKQFPVWKWRFRKFLPKDKKAKILDLGCGKSYSTNSTTSPKLQALDRRD